MARYCYTTFDGGLTVEHPLSIHGFVPSVIVLDSGEAAYRDIRAEWNGRRFAGGLYPRLSDAAGVHPDQIQQAMAADRRLGVPAKYTADGRVQFDSRAHEKAFLEAHGMYHLNSYGLGGDADRERANRSRHSWKHPDAQDDVDVGA